MVWQVYMAETKILNMNFNQMQIGVLWENREIRWLTFKEERFSLRDWERDSFDCDSVLRVFCVFRNFLDSLLPNSFLLPDLSLLDCSNFARTFWESLVIFSLIFRTWNFSKTAIIKIHKKKKKFWRLKLILPLTDYNTDKIFWFKSFFVPFENTVWNAYRMFGSCISTGKDC